MVPILVIGYRSYDAWSVIQISLAFGLSIVLGQSLVGLSLALGLLLLFEGCGSIIDRLCSVGGLLSLSFRGLGRSVIVCARSMAR